MAFCTTINCMDGRVQLPVILFLQKRFGVEYVDSITEAGPNRILAEQTDTVLVQSIIERLKISVNKHKSVGIAVVGHDHCAGNPAPYEDQIIQVKESLRMLGTHFKSITLIGLWVDSNWQVHEVG